MPKSWLWNPANRGLLDGEGAASGSTPFVEQIPLQPNGQSEAETKPIPNVFKPQQKHSVNELWSIYNAETAKFDQEISAKIRSNMDGLLIFSGLFSAAVTAFIIESYKSLSPDPADTTVFYLMQMTQQMAFLANGSGTSSPPPILFDPSTFSPASSIVRVNAFWILSLVLSLIVALGATLVQGWSDQYLRLVGFNTEPQVSARLRTFYYNGLRRSQLSLLAWILPALLHLSVFLFFAGLVQFLHPINETIATTIMLVPIVGAFVYAFLTLVPFLIGSTPFSTPFTEFFVMIFGIVSVVGLILWLLIAAIAFPVAIFLRLEDKSLANKPRQFYNAAKAGAAIIHDTSGDNWPVDWSSTRARTKRNQLRRKPPKTEEDAQVDVRVLRWLLRRTSDDEEIERFIEGMESFLLAEGNDLNTRVVLNLATTPTSGRTTDEWLAYRTELLLTSCTNSTSLSDSQRQRRVKACTRMYWALGIKATLEQRLDGPVLDVDTEAYGLMWSTYVKELVAMDLPWWQRYFPLGVLIALRTLKSDKDPAITLHVQCISALVVHHSAIDLAHRMDNGSVKVYVSNDTWTGVDVAVKLHHATIGNLYETIMAIELLPELPADQTILDAGVDANYTTQGRQVSVTIGPNATTLVSGTAVQNDLCLIALNTLLEYFSTHPADFSQTSDRDLVIGTFRTITSGWEAKGTKKENQATFVRLADNIARDLRVKPVVEGSTAAANEASHDVMVDVRQRGIVVQVLDMLRAIAETLDDPESIARSKRAFARETEDFLELDAE